MKRFGLTFGARADKSAQAIALPDDLLAQSCAACARQDAAALVVDGLRHEYGDQGATLQDVSLCLHPGEIVALVGPSGCGKTTTLRLIAGLERLQEGALRIGGLMAAAPGLHVPAENRNIGMMFQDYALFPHLTVAENVAFGLGRLDSTQRREQALEALADVGLAEFADRYPTTMSGGQQQRVALARALAPRPNVVLLDEPFSGLDAELRRSVRSDAIHLLKAAGAAALMVTHDPEEALFMAERIAVMRDGRIEQCDTPKALYDHPASPYVARFFSEVNEFAGTVRANLIRTPMGLVEAPGMADGAQALVMARPEHILVGEAALETGASFAGNVSFARWLGRTALIEVRLETGEAVFARISDKNWPDEGEAVEVALDPEHVHVFAGDRDAAPVIADIAKRDRANTSESLAFSG